MQKKTHPSEKPGSKRQQRSAPLWNIFFSSTFFFKKKIIFLTASKMSTWFLKIFKKSSPNGKPSFIFTIFSQWPVLHSSYNSPFQLGYFSTSFNFFKCWNLLRCTLSFFLSHIGITRNRNCNNFNIFYGSRPFCKFLILLVWHHSAKGVRTHVFTTLINQWSRMNCLWLPPINIDENFHQYFFLKFLFINTYKATPSHLGLQSVLLYHRLVYLLHTNINLNLITADQPGFEPRSTGSGFTCFKELSWTTVF